MKPLSAIDLGYSDAINYKNKRLAKMFSNVFVKDVKLESLMRPNTYFLIGEKGTGKTAYSTFLENSEYKNTISNVEDINSTDYKIFMNLSKMNLLQLADFTRIWKIILLMIMSKNINKREVEAFGPKRSELLLKLKESIDKYYKDAFTPEISNTFKYIMENTYGANTDISINALAGKVGVNGELSLLEKIGEEHSIQKFQNNLLQLETQFSNAFSRLKLNKSKFLFIDSVDIRVEGFSQDEYLLCLTGLANAIWDININIFRSMPESNGFLKIILSIRPDIFEKLELHNKANKIRDNSVLLDWRTTYENYRTSNLFKLCNKLLAYENEGLAENEYWDYYFPWYTKSTNHMRENDSSFINCLRLSLSRPRDIISIMKAIQNTSKDAGNNMTATLNDFESNSTQNEISNYYIDEAKDWCLHRFSNDQFNVLLFFFSFLNGKSKFTYEEYLLSFKDYFSQVDTRNMGIFEELFNENDFLQLLYDLNMICYYDKDQKGNILFRFCYREREIYNLNPKVKSNSTYGVHYALLKSLNLGKSALPSEF